MDKYGYIDVTGELVIPPQFKFAQPFSGKYAQAKTYVNDAPNHEMIGCIVDTTGNVYRIKNMHHYGRYAEGLIQVTPKTNYGKTGFADINNNLIIPALYDSATNFYHDRAIVSKIADDNRSYYVLIDNVGRELKQFKIQGYISDDWAEGLAILRANSGEYIYVDRDGDEVIHAPGSVSYPFSEGLAAFSVHLTKPDYTILFGFFDKSGKIVIEPIFDLVLSFSEGLACAKLNDRWLYIDRNGKEAFELPQDCRDVNSFSYGLASVQLGGEALSDEENYGVKFVGAKWGFVDKTGCIVISPKFKSVLPFGDNGLAGASVIVDGEELYGFIDRTGEFVIEPQFVYVGTFSAGLAPVLVSSGKFDPVDWKNWELMDEYPSRREQLRKFFKDYPVIGMTREQIYHLLGAGFKQKEQDIESYGYITNWCGNACKDFQLLYEDNRVAGWRFSSLNHVPLFEYKKESFF